MSYLTHGTRKPGLFRDWFTVAFVLACATWIAAVVALIVWWAL